MNAFFQCESGVGVGTPSSSGTNVMCGREGWVGLNGNWGEFKLGYGLTPYDDVLGLAGHFGSTGLEHRNNGVSGGLGFGPGSANGLFQNYYGGQVSTLTGAFDARYSNSVSYKTPTWAGFNLRTQYSIIDETATKKGKGWDTAGIWNNGPATLALTYAGHANFSGVGGTIGSLAAPMYNDQQALRGYGAWNFGFMKIDGTLEQLKYKFDNAPLAGYGNSFKALYYELGVTAPVGAWVLGAQYSTRDKGLAHAYNASLNTAGVNSSVFNPTPAMLANWNEGGGDHWALVADYNLSKRTLVRSLYGWLRNEGTYNTVTNKMDGNSKIQQIAVVLWHNF
jgi:predicted porin